jgi:hypothetical protein
MIAIINISPENQEKNCLYRIQINYKKICEFRHDRKDGLAVCLQKAANAVADYFQISQKTVTDYTQIPPKHDYR